MSTTVAFVQMLTGMLKDSELGPCLVPIVADEARTFGMESLFRKVGIYSDCGQLYEPEDHDALLYYKESRDGQILEEGITEAGALSSWIAAGTSYSHHGITHGALLHLLFDLWVSTRRRPDLGGRRFTGSRVFGWGHSGPHDPVGRRLAAPGWFQSSHRFYHS